VKIDKIDCFRLRSRVDSIKGGGSGWVTSRSALFVRIRTSDGVVGWGEAGQTGPTFITKHLIEHVLSPIYLGQNPFDPEVLWERAYLQTRDFGQKGQIIGAISGLDIALYDIIGKVTGQPVYRLLGGLQHDRIPAYATGLWYRRENDSVEALVEDALSFKKKGFRAMKVKVGLGSIQYDVARVRGLRKALGDDVDLMLDANHALSVGSAIELGRRVEEFNVGWLEEPTVPEDIEGYRHIRRMTRIPIAGGECEFTRFGFRNLLSRQALDIAQPDICGSGGFTELKKIAAMANAYGVQVVPHSWNSLLGVVASIHLIASLPNCPSSAAPKPFREQAGLEYDQSQNDLRDSIAPGAIEFEDGYVKVGDKPGLGIDLTEEMLGPWLDDGSETLSVGYHR
jgi:D-galactarolactone cycloisomerase